jgi:hypothetical protein
MKHIISFTFCMATIFFCNAQPVSKTLPQKTSGIQTLKPVGVNTPMSKLPDLTFTGVNVTATATGVGVYTLEISFTVKNEGTAPILTSDVTIQGYLTDEVGFARTQDISFTGTYRPGCGTGLGSGLGVYKGEMLQPGESKGSSMRCFNIQLQKTPRPIYYFTINPHSDIKELNMGNNRVPFTILL